MATDPIKVTACFKLTFLANYPVTTLISAFWQRNAIYYGKFTKNAPNSSLVT